MGEAGERDGGLGREVSMLWRRLWGIEAAQGFAPAPRGAEPWVRRRMMDRTKVLRGE